MRSRWVDGVSALGELVGCMRSRWVDGVSALGELVMSDSFAVNLAD